MKNRFISLIAVFLVCFTISACNWQATPTGTTDPVLTNATEPADFEPPAEGAFIDFGGYADYMQYMLGSAEITVPINSNIKSYIQSIRNAPETFLVPYHNGKPVVLRDLEGYSGICVMDELYHLVWTWFYTDIQEQPVTIRLSKLSEEHAVLEKALTAPEFIAQIAPDAPNVTNFETQEGYTAIFAENAVIGGVDTSMLVKRTEGGEEYFTFLQDGYLVIISAPLDTITKDWLRYLSLGVPESVRNTASVEKGQ